MTLDYLDTSLHPVLYKQHHDVSTTFKAKLQFIELQPEIHTLSNVYRKTPRYVWTVCGGMLVICISYVQIITFEQGTIKTIPKLLGIYLYNNIIQTVKTKEQLNLSSHRYTTITH